MADLIDDEVNIESGLIESGIVEFDFSSNHHPAEGLHDGASLEAGGLESLEAGGLESLEAGDLQKLIDLYRTKPQQLLVGEYLCVDHSQLGNMALTCEQVILLMYALFDNSLQKRIALAQGLYHRIIDRQNFTMVLDKVDSLHRPHFMHIDFFDVPKLVRDNEGRVEVARRLGWLKCWNPLRAEGNAKRSVNPQPWLMSHHYCNGKSVSIYLFGCNTQNTELPMAAIGPWLPLGHGCDWVMAAIGPFTGFYVMDMRYPDDQYVVKYHF